MASKHHFTIRLDPHYQQFLRAHFKCEEEVFEFPPRHFFNTQIEHFVSTRASNWVDRQEDDWTFKIAVPNMAYKNPSHFKYMTAVKEGIFKAKIKEFYDWIILDHIKELMRGQKVSGCPAEKLDRQQCTLVVIEEFGFNTDTGDAFDRLYKLFTRHKRTESNRRVYEKVKKKKVAHG